MINSRFYLPEIRVFSLNHEEAMVHALNASNNQSLHWTFNSSWIGRHKASEFIRALNDEPLKSENNVYLIAPYTFDRIIGYKNFIFAEHLEFSNRAISIALHIKKKFNFPARYKSIHLRIEIDIIEQLRDAFAAVLKNINATENESFQRFLILKALQSYYTREIVNNFDSSDIIYVSTDVEKYSIENKDFLKSLFKYFPKIVTTPTTLMKSLWGQQYGKELSALTDLMICEGAFTFLGFNPTPFSRLARIRMLKSNRRKKKAIFVLKDSLNMSYIHRLSQQDFINCLNISMTNETFEGLKRFGNCAHTI